MRIRRRPRREVIKARVDLNNCEGPGFPEIAQELKDLKAMAAEAAEAADCDLDFQIVI